MITAENRKERVAKAEQAGAAGFIVEPFNAQALSARIAAVMARGSERATAAQSSAGGDAIGAPYGAALG
jgi:DNA-binding response OmpR family regulator